MRISNKCHATHCAVPRSKIIHKPRVFDCKFSPQELMLHYTRLRYLNIEGWDSYISGETEIFKNMKW